MLNPIRFQFEEACKVFQVLKGAPRKPPHQGLMIKVATELGFQCEDSPANGWMKATVVQQEIALS